MKPIPGWFQDRSRAQLSALIQEHQVKDVIEIGSFLGLSTSFFAEHCDHVYAIDPFVAWPEGEQNGDARAAGKDFYFRFLNNMADRSLLGKITPIRLHSFSAAMLAIDADLIYIDAEHDHHSVRRDIDAWLPRAKKVICGDDYDENWPGVVEAVNEVFGVENVHVAGNLWWVIPNELSEIDQKPL